MIGEKLRALRKQKGLSQIKFAELAGLSTNSIARYERNEISPTENNLQKIASALGITVSELLKDSDKFTKQSEYLDVTNIESNEPSMAYWGALIDNAKKVSVNNSDLDVILSICKKATGIIKEKILRKEEKNT